VIADGGIDVRPEPSPKNEPAVTFPATTMLLSTTRPVVVFVNWTVLDVVFPAFTTLSRFKSSSVVSSDVTYIFPPFNLKFWASRFEVLSVAFVISRKPVGE
jgi:hypothetical protein